MDLGQFSTSLTVKDLAASRRFYETLGFSIECGSEEENWLFMASGNTRIGLFKDMFDDNILTFNPPDARMVQTAMKEAGYSAVKEADAGDGPCHVVLKDPDGNTVMLDQF